MEDNQTPKPVATAGESEPTPEPTAAPAPKNEPPAPKNEPPAPGYTEQFDEIKKAYEDKLSSQKADFDRQIKERDEVIKQLIKGEPAIMPKGLAPEEHESYIDKINAKRVFKW